MNTVFCFGELLLRLSPSLDRKWLKEAVMPVYLGGAELNVATALAKWNVPVKYFTALPDHYLSKEITAELTTRNIDVSPIHFSGNRIGTYYLPQGADLKSTGVIYDRDYSSFASLKPGMINWDEVLKDCSWFHYTAICPALNENIAAVCLEAMKAASAKGITISVDLNYRPKLWQYGKQPPAVMPALVEYSDVIMGNIWAVESLLGIPSPLKDSNGKTKEELDEAAKNIMIQLMDVYPKVHTASFTYRLEKEYWGLLYKDKQFYSSKQYAITEVIDKAGSGDCFMGGLIYSSVNHLNNQEAIEFAASAAVGKLKETGDITNQTAAIIMRRYQ